MPRKATTPKQDYERALATIAAAGKPPSGHGWHVEVHDDGVPRAVAHRRLVGTGKSNVWVSSSGEERFAITDQASGMRLRWAETRVGAAAVAALLNSWTRDDYQARLAEGFERSRAANRLQRLLADTCRAAEVEHALKLEEARRARRAPTHTLEEAVAIACALDVVEHSEGGA